MYPPYRNKSFWDALDSLRDALGQTIQEKWGDFYNAIDTAAGGWLPGGVNSPEVAANAGKEWTPPADTTPFLGGIHEAMSKAFESPTTPEHLFQARDVPLIGGALRAAEAGVNLLNLPAEWGAGQAAMGIQGVRQALSPLTGDTGFDQQKLSEWRGAWASGDVERLSQLGGEALQETDPRLAFALQLGADPTNLVTFGLTQVRKAQALSKMTELASKAEKAAEIAQAAGDAAKAESLTAEAAHWRTLVEAAKGGRMEVAEKALRAGLGQRSWIEASEHADDLDAAKAAMMREGAFVKGRPAGASLAEKALTMLDPFRYTNEARAAAAADDTTNILGTLMHVVKNDPMAKPAELLQAFITNKVPSGPAYDPIRILARSRAGVATRVVLREMFGEGDKLNLTSFVREAADPKLTVPMLMERWHQRAEAALSKIYPSTPRNPYQQAVARFKDFATRWMYMGHAPGMTVNNLIGNLIPMVWDGAFDIGATLQDLAHRASFGKIPESKLRAWYKRAGFAPVEAGRGVTSADIEFAKKLESKLPFYKKAWETFKYGEWLKVNELIEQASSKRIYWSRFKTYFTNFIKASLPRPDSAKLPADVADAVIGFATVNAHDPASVRKYLLTLRGTTYRRAVLSADEVATLTDVNSPLHNISDKIVSILQETHPGGAYDTPEKFAAAMRTIEDDAVSRAVLADVSAVRQKHGLPPSISVQSQADDLVKEAAKDIAESAAEAGEEAAKAGVWIPSPAYDRAITARKAIKDVINKAGNLDQQREAENLFQQTERIRAFMVGRHREEVADLLAGKFDNAFAEIVAEATRREAERPFLQSPKQRGQAWENYYFPLATRLENALAGRLTSIADAIPPTATKPVEKTAAKAEPVEAAAKGKRRPRKAQQPEAAAPAPAAAAPAPAVTPPTAVATPAGTTLPQALSAAAEQTAQVVSNFIDGMVKRRLASWNETMSGLSKAEIDALEAWYHGVFMPKATMARQQASKMAVLDRDFALHNYSQKHNYDVWLAYIMPYAFWQTETGRKWAERIARNPQVLLSYARYREKRMKLEQELPPAYRNQIAFEINGMPFMVNIEATFNPLYQMIENFQDSARSATPAGKIVDTINQLGPTIYAPLQIAFGLTQPDAAAWIPYMTGTTRLIQAVTSAAGIGGPQGVNIEAIPRAALSAAEPAVKAAARQLPLARELGLGYAPPSPYEPYSPDTAIPAEASGIPAYEKYDPGRVMRSLLALKEQGAINPETRKPLSDRDIEKAIFTRSGAAWDMGMQETARRRLLSIVTGFTLGKGLKPRDEVEVELYKVRQEYYNIRNIQDPQARKDAYKKFYEANPWYPANKAASLSGAELEAAWRKQDLFNIIDDFVTPRFRAKMTADERAALERFYETKGDLTQMTAAQQAALEAALARARETEAQLTPEQKAERALASDLMAQYQEIKKRSDKEARAFWEAHDAVLSRWYGDPEVSRIYDVLGEYLTPRIRRELTADERGVIDRFYETKGDFTKFTPSEMEILKLAMLKLEKNYRALSKDEQEELRVAREQIAEYYRIKNTQGTAAARAYWNAHPLLEQWYGSGGQTSGQTGGQTGGKTGGKTSGQTSSAYNALLRRYLAVGHGGGARARGDNAGVSGANRTAWKPVTHRLPRGKLASDYWRMKR